MAITLAHPGLPSSNGATIIQTSNFALGAVYEEIDYEEALRRVKSIGQHLFVGFPMTKPNATAGWTFFERNNMTNGSENLSTLVALQVTMRNTIAAPNNVLASVSRVNIAIKSWLAKVHLWAPVKLTTTDGQIYHDVAYSGAAITGFLDPELQVYVLPTNGYQMQYEAANFLLTPVAGTTPTSGPLFKALNGRNPVG